MSSGLTIYEETHSRATLTPAEIYLWSKKPSIVLSLPVVENRLFTSGSNPNSFTHLPKPISAETRLKYTIVLGARLNLLI